MNMDRFTTMARQSIASAQAQAVESRHAQLSPLHLLCALLADDKSIANDILDHAGRQPDVLRQLVQSELDRLPNVQSNSGYTPQTAPDLLNVLMEAEKLAASMEDGYTSQEHLLLALSEVPSPAREAMKTTGLDANTVRAAIESIRKASGIESIDDADAESNFEALKKYGIDLNNLAISGKLDPVIGRDEEIRRCMQVLSRRTKNNPVLIGEPGVGKTAIAEDSRDASWMATAHPRSDRRDHRPRCGPAACRPSSWRVRGSTQGGPELINLQQWPDHPLHR